MNGLNIEDTNKKLIISIDKETFSESVLLKVMKIARTEYLINKAGFTESLFQLDEEIKTDWWQHNKDEILRKNNT